MRFAVLALILFQAYRVPATKPAENTNPGACHEWVKWRVLVTGDVPNPVPASEVPVTAVEFWTATTATDQVAATMSIANNGAFGTSYIDGHHNTSHAHAFFPPRQVVGARYEFDCLR